MHFHDYWEGAKKEGEGKNQNHQKMHQPSSSQLSRKEKKTVFPQWGVSSGKRHEQNTAREETFGFELYCTKRERRSVGQPLPRFSSRSGHGSHGGYREGRHLHLLCPQLSPSSSSTPRGHPGGAAQAAGRAGGEAGGGGCASRAGSSSARTDRAGRAASPGAAPGSRLRARPGGGGNAGASSRRPAARTHPRSLAPTPPAARRPPP